ncbi:MAG: helix-turn-helix transcriptional regulator [Planctomycetaceae bacterium]|nr:helix-turn-helix transcriptional regulator [Planctomycetaceae bacterium]
MTVTDTLRQAIRASGKTHYQLAKEAGIAPNQLDLFVSGVRGLRLETLDKLAPVLGLRLTALTMKRQSRMTGGDNAASET